MVFKVFLPLLVLGVLSVSGRPEIGTNKNAEFLREGKAQAMTSQIDSANLPAEKNKEEGETTRISKEMHTLLNGGEIPVQLVYESGEAETEAVVKEVSGEGLTRESTGAGIRVGKGRRMRGQDLPDVDADDLNKQLGIEARFNKMGKSSIHAQEKKGERIQDRPMGPTGQSIVEPYVPRDPIYVGTNIPVTVYKIAPTFLNPPVITLYEGAWPAYANAVEYAGRWRRGIRRWRTKRETGNVDHSGAQIMRLKVRRGGVAIAGPGGVATAGSGGTAIVGPGGTAYTTRDGIAVVGPGGKLIQVPKFDFTSVVQARGSTDVFRPPEGGKLIATGPVVYYNPGVERGFSFPIKPQNVMMYLPEYNVFVVPAGSVYQTPPPQKRRRPLVALVKLFQTRFDPSTAKNGTGTDNSSVTTEQELGQDQNGAYQENPAQAQPSFPYWMAPPAKPQPFSPPQNSYFPQLTDQRLKLEDYARATGEREETLNEVRELIEASAVRVKEAKETVAEIEKTALPFITYPFPDTKQERDPTAGSVPDVSELLGMAGVGAEGHVGIGVMEREPGTRLVLRPSAKAVAGPGGVAVASPIARAVLSRGRQVALEFDPQAVAVAGPGGRAHTHPTLLITYANETDTDQDDPRSPTF